MATTKPTFKINRSTGKYRSFFPPSVDIKIKKKKCGLILANGQYTGGAFKVGLQIVKEPTKLNPAPFEWVWFKARFEGMGAIEKAKTWVVENWEKLTEGRELYFSED